MKKLFAFTMLLLFCLSGYSQTTKLTSISSADYFQTIKGTVEKKVSPSIVAAYVKTQLDTVKEIKFRITQTDSTDLADTTVYSEFSDTLTYTLARSSTGTFTLTCDNGTPFTANKTEVSFSQGQGTAKIYFSATVTSTSVLTLYSYLQTTDALTDTGFGSGGTFLRVQVHP